MVPLEKYRTKRDFSKTTEPRGRKRHGDSLKNTLKAVEK